MRAVSTGLATIFPFTRLCRAELSHAAELEVIGYTATTFSEAGWARICFTRS
jgi:hypothetical protein